MLHIIIITTIIIIYSSSSSILFQNWTDTFLFMVLLLILPKLIALISWNFFNFRAAH